MRDNTIEVKSQNDDQMNLTARKFLEDISEPSSKTIANRVGPSVSDKQEIPREELARRRSEHYGGWQTGILG